MSFQPVHRDLLFSRNDPRDPRLGEWVHPLANDLKTWTHTHPNGVAILGYPDDEGIRLNGGRPGASLAPDTVRKYLYRMTPPVMAPSLQRPAFTDGGNLNLHVGDLEARHAAASQMAHDLLKSGARVLSLGGGHDYGFSDGAAFIDSLSHTAANSRPLVLNIDAHLDVRPLDRGLTSGTPFYRLLEKYPDIDFAEIGIQDQCNSQAHLQWAQEKGARILALDSLLYAGVSWHESVLQRLEPWLVRRRPAFLSIDIDAFSSAYAPGCSQSWATGFDPAQFFVLLQTLLRRLDVRVLGIYEVSPPLDSDDRTAKLAAQIAYRFLFPL